MNTKTSQTTICSQESINNSSFNTKINNYLQVYRIKVDDIRNNSSEDIIQRNIYLNIKFDDSNQTIIQTQCIDIINDNKYFEIKTKANIAKIEILNYQQMKKLSKISLKGINKEFKHTHLEEKNKIQILIQRTHVSLELFQTKCKLSNSIIIDNDNCEEKQCDSTDDSSSQVSN